MRIVGAARAAAAEPGPRFIDLGRGNPDLPPPPHALEAMRTAAADLGIPTHGYPPFRGLPELLEAVAERYRLDHGVELDPAREIAVVPGGAKFGIITAALSAAAAGSASCSCRTLAIPTTSRVSRWRTPRPCRCRWRAPRGSRTSTPSRPRCARGWRSRSSTTRPTRARPARRLARSRPPWPSPTRPGRGSSPTWPTGSWPSTAGARAACSRSTVHARSPPSSGRRRRSTAWRAGGSASSSATRSSCGARSC